MKGMLIFRDAYTGCQEPGQQEQETQLPLTYRAIHLCKCNGVDHLKTSPYVTMSQLFVLR